MKPEIENHDAVGGCSESAGSALWTCIARCKICHKELNRAEHVPEHDKTRVTISAPLMAICDVKQHNTLSDCNMGVELEWIMETPNAGTQRPGSPDGSLATKTRKPGSLK